MSVVNEYNDIRIPATQKKKIYLTESFQLTVDALDS